MQVSERASEGELERVSAGQMHKETRKLRGNKQKLSNSLDESTRHLDTIFSVRVAAWSPVYPPDCCDCRYYAILHPMRAKYVCTVGRARRAIFILWVVSLVLAMPIVFQTVSCLPSLLPCRLLVVTFSSFPVT